MQAGSGEAVQLAPCRLLAPLCEGSLDCQQLLLFARVPGARISSLAFRYDYPKPHMYKMGFGTEVTSRGVADHGV